jgi:hypothetical protein
MKVAARKRGVSAGSLADAVQQAIAVANSNIQIVKRLMGVSSRTLSLEH